MESYVYKERLGKPVYRSVLSNGVNVFTAPLPSRMVTTEIVLPYGAYEDGEHLGSAHFLEHLLLKGPNRDGVHPVKIPLIAKGVKGNGGTNFFLTKYFFEGLAVDFEIMLKGLLEICTCPLFNEEQLEREKGIILNEAQISASTERFNDWLRKMAYPKYPRLYNSVIGTPESIQRIDMDALQGYIAREFCFSRMMFFAAGGVTHEEHVAFAEDATASATIQSTARGIARKTFPFTLFTENYIDERVSAPELLVCFRSDLNARDSRLLGLAISLLNNTDIGILFSKLRNEHGLVYSVSAGRSSHPLSYCEISTTCAAKDMDRIVDLIWECLEQLMNDAYPDALFTSVMAQREVFFATRDEIATRSRFMTMMRDMWLEDDYEDVDPKNIALSATREEIAEVAKKVFRRDAYGVVKILHPK